MLSTRSPLSLFLSFSPLSLTLPLSLSLSPPLNSLSPPLFLSLSLLSSLSLSPSPSPPLTSLPPLSLPLSCWDERSDPSTVGHVHIRPRLSCQAFPVDP